METRIRCDINDKNYSSRSLVSSSGNPNREAFLRFIIIIIIKALNVSVLKREIEDKVNCRLI